MRKLLLIPGILVISLTTCIDPYTLELDEYESLLVVDGMITDETASHTIKLSRTFQNEGIPPLMVSHAEVNVRDENGEITLFPEQEPGIYKSDSTQFSGRIGGTYTLHIRTDDGLEFESDPCTMTAVPEIDSIYYTTDKEFFNNGMEEEKGLRIFLDACNENEACQYFRWEFEEVWKFKVPYPVKVKYLGGGKYEWIPVENEFCWKYRKSSEVLIHSTEELSTSQINRKPIKFIASGKSDRLLQQYSILVKQYSLSQNEYAFWKNLQEVTESGGDIFERQPFSIIGNIRCTNRENEKVMGYFQVSAVTKMRKYITYGQIYDLDIPYYKHSCETIRSIVMIYGYVLYSVDLIIVGGGVLNEYMFTTPECSDCSLNGNPNRPDFWVDMY